MSSRTTWILAAALACGLVACGATPPTPVPPGPETCDNGKDDNGDGKTDCLDPTCFSAPNCQVKVEDCTNGVDDTGDGFADCADPYCAGMSCGADCTCVDGLPNHGTGGGGGAAGGGTGGASGGGAGGGATGGGAGGGTGGGATGGGGGATGGGSGGGATGGGSGGGATGGGSGGGATGGGSGGGATGGGTGGGATGGGTGGGIACVGCGAGCVCTNGVKAEVLCSDNIDNDTDNLTDCEDPDCNNVTCGMGCTCVGSAKKETNCTDGQDNDGDSLADCADPDCFGVGTENCTDGIDNTCDRAIDCGDSRCTGNAACTNVQDGKPCLLDSQCAGGDCLDEATNGMPNGMCSNATSCTVSTNAGCNGGICMQGTTFNTCFARCTGTGISGTGACRVGYTCFDPDTNTTNNNSGCLPLCTSDSECAAGGSGYGCNAWRKRCGNLDRGLGKYGAACTSASQCESSQCFTGTNSPGGYCTGPCRGDTRNCGPNGYCYFDPSYGDNYGACYQACASSAECRQSESYKCRQVSSGSSDYVCLCLPAGVTCSGNSDCCSGSCTFDYLYLDYTCD